jgi:hypothetical protein
LYYGGIMNVRKWYRIEKKALNKLKRKLSPDNLNNLKQLELQRKETILEAK